MPKDFSVKKTYSHSEDEPGSVRVELKFDNETVDEFDRDYDDDDYDEPFLDDVRGYVFDMINTAIREHRKAMKQPEEDKDDG